MKRSDSGISLSGTRGLLYGNSARILCHQTGYFYFSAFGYFSPSTDILAHELAYRLCVQGELRYPGRQALWESEAEFMGEYLRVYLSPHRDHQPERLPSGLVEAHGQPPGARPGKPPRQRLTAEETAPSVFVFRGHRCPRPGSRVTAALSTYNALRRVKYGFSYRNWYLFRENPVFHKPISNSI